MRNAIWELKQYAGQPALINDDGSVLDYEVLEVEGRTLADQIGGRRLVFCLCRNEIGSVLGYTGFLNNGIVPVLLSSQLDRTLLDQLLNTYRPPFIWMPDELCGQFKNMEARYNAFGYTLLRTSFDAKYQLHEELALLLTTSGSTGSPKFVRQSYTNIMDNAQSIVHYLELDETERPITTLPMNYTYGLSIINSHLLVGAAVLVTEQTLMQKGFWDFFQSAGATSFGGVPYTYEILDKLRFSRMNLPTLRTLTQAGGKLSPELHEKFAKYAEDTNRKFVVMYGQCEATARMGYLPAYMAVKKKGSMGIAIPGGKFRLIDTDGKDITLPQTTGELVYEGKNVTLGYAECGEDLEKGDERNGVLVTGDMAQFDEDGYYYIVGRKKRFLKIYGNRVNLDEMDQLIKTEFNTDVACAGRDDHMYVFVTDESMAESVKAFASVKTGLNPAAFKMVVIEEIPKNDAGKTQFKELEKYYDI